MILSAPASIGGASSASAAGDEGVASAFAGFLARQAPTSGKAGQAGPAVAGMETVADEDQGQTPVLMVPAPAFAPTPPAADVASAPLLAIQGQLLNLAPTSPTGLPAPEDDAGTTVGGDAGKTMIPPLTGDGTAGPPLQTLETAGASAAPVASAEPAGSGMETKVAAPHAGDPAGPGVSRAMTERGGPATAAVNIPVSATPTPTPPSAPTPAPGVGVEAAVTSPTPGPLTAVEDGLTLAGLSGRVPSGPVEASQMAARGALPVPSGEAARMMQPMRGVTDEAGRRGERPPPFMNPLLASTSESGEATARPTSNGQNASFFPSLSQGGLTPTGPQGGQVKADATPPPAQPLVEASLPEGEAEATGRPLDSPSSAPLLGRDGLPSGLSRATIETTALMAAQIVRRLEGRSTRFEMALTPEGLGRVDVSMEIDSEGRLAARLAFDNPAAAAELRGRVDDLRRQLEASGFHLGEDALEFTDRESRRDHAPDNPFDRRPDRAFAGAGRLIDDAPATPPPSRWAALALTPEGVDMKV
ncbi:MAG: flagellar hook-length control protein FliK [Brevundimonas sp.]|uniref:flagellar hook-length control protein FliK n=1 Tax=Brevundimonas sp. TaxID=1871086 RepID=UPI00391BF320